MKRRGRVLAGVPMWIVAAGAVCAGGCERPAPPPSPPPTTANEDTAGGEQASQPAEDGAIDSGEDAAAGEPVPVVTPPTIPDEPLAGTLDGRPFVFVGAALEGSVLTLTDAEGRRVAVVMFGEVPATLDLTGHETPFGSPHVVVHAGPDEPAAVFMDGYRLLLGGGGIWLELPDGRGTLAGRFSDE